MAKEIFCGFGVDVDAVAGWLAEQTPVDMESTLLALARGMRVAA